MQGRDEAHGPGTQGGKGEMWASWAGKRQQVPKGVRKRDLPGQEGCSSRGTAPARQPGGHGGWEATERRGQGAGQTLLGSFHH